VPADDPDDVIDPNDSGPRLSVTLKDPVAEIYALPAAQAQQTSGCGQILAINQKRHNRFYERQRRRQALL
jgi:hypothetical protein